MARVTGKPREAFDAVRKKRGPWNTMFKSIDLNEYQIVATNFV